MTACIYPGEFAQGDVLRLGKTLLICEKGHFSVPANNYAEIEVWNPDHTEIGPLTVTRRGKSGDLTFKPWKYQPWATVDLEATGAGHDAKIVEIGIVRSRFGQVLDVWSSLVNPGCPIPNDVVSIHGIDDEMVKDAPSIDLIRDDIESRLADVDVVVAYNGYGYDEVLLKNHGIAITAPVICPFTIVRTKAISGAWESTWTPPPESPDDLFEPDESGPEYRQKVGGRYRLAAVADRFELAYAEGAVPRELHRASWDAVLAQRILWHVRHQCGADPKHSEAALRKERERQQKGMDAYMAKKDREREERLERRRAAGRETVVNNREWLRSELAAFEGRIAEMIARR